MDKKIRSIRVKLVFILSLTAMLAIFLSSVVQFWYTYQEGKANALHTLTQTASILGENLSASLEFDDADSATLILSALKLNKSIEVAYLLKDKENIFAKYFKNDVYDRKLLKEALKLYDTNSIKEHITFNNMKNLIVSEPIYFDGQYLASFMLIANTTKLKESLKRQLTSQLIISIFIAIMIIFFAMFIQKVFTLPIFSLKAAMDDVRENSNYDAQIDFHSNDEFQSLFDGFYKMIETIKNQKEEQRLAQQKIETMHKHTRESIEYASMIQGALLPDEKLMDNYFKDYFVHWMPKDTVGGDIWLLNTLRNEDECLLFFIDCTGHGVPGAFVTMIVKAIEREIVAKIVEDKNMEVSPAWIMSYFNQTMKVLLKQETKDSKSNAGWDGGIIYYNKKDQILKFAGAETPLFYIDLDGELKTVKGNRYSVGYKKCAMDYEYKETIIEVKEGMKFYCTTDGFLDQNGGNKDFPFGKKRFGNIIKENYAKPMMTQKDIFVDTMEEYESIMAENHDRNDDMTVIAFEIGVPSESNEDNIIEIMKYEGIITQNIIATAIDNIEAKVTNNSALGYVSTITIEYCQNMMNYSKNEDLASKQIVPAGQIEIQYINDEYYEIIATNIVSLEDKQKIEPKLTEIQLLDKAGIRKRYRELRKSGKNTHEKGGGIGMYEIAKISDGIEYEFQAINEDKYYFTMKSFVKPKERRATDRRKDA